MSTWLLVLALAALLALVQIGLWLLARGLGRRLDRSAVAGGLLLPFVLLAPWLGPERLLVPSDTLREQVPGLFVADPDPRDLLNDVMFQLIPWELEVRHALAAGRLPLWSDDLAGGSSPWINPQAGALSPLAMASRPLPIQYFALVMLALKVLVAFEGAWLLARQVGARRPAALLAGGGFALGGGVAVWALFPITATVVWVPWVTAGAVGLARRPAPGRIAATAVATAALLLSGNPETALAGGVLAVAAAIGLGRRGAPRPRGLAAAAAAALLGFALAAPLLVPFLTAAPGSLRAQQTVVRPLPAAHPRLAAPGSWFFEGRGRFWRAPASRRAFGWPFGEPFRGPIGWLDASAPYAGVAAFGGSLAALAAWLAGRRRRRTALPFLAFALGSLVLAAQPVPLFRLLWSVPALRVPAFDRFLPVAALALAVAGALGIDALLGRRAARGALAGFALAAALGLAVAADAAAVGLWAAAAAAVWLGRRRYRWGAALLAAVLLADLVPWARAFQPTGRPETFYPRNAVLTAMAAEVGRDGPWRAVGQDLLVYPALLPVYGIPEVRPHNALAPAAQMEVLAAGFDFEADQATYFAPFRRPDQTLLDFLNVRVVLSNEYLPQPGGFERIERGEFGIWRLWRNADALPRWFLASAAEVVEPAALGEWIRNLDDPRRVALAAAEVGGWRPAATPGAGPVAVESLVPGRVVLRLPPGASERLLATSLPSPRGWQARAEGRSLRRLTVNGAFLGVVVPPQIGRLELAFTPPGFWAGWGLCALAAAALVGLLATRSRRAAFA